MLDLPQTSAAVRFAAAVRGAGAREGADAFVEKPKPSLLVRVEEGA
jgi:hypothetical protein